MTKRLLAYLCSKKLLLLQCAIVFAVCLVATGLAKTWMARIVPVNGGFDFEPRMNSTGSGPALGTQMDLSRYRTRNGSSLKDALNGRPALLFVVDPQCPACQAASDQLTGIREGLSVAGVATVIVMFSKTENAANAFSYAESLVIGSEAFVSPIDETVKTDSVFRMVVPSQILVDKEGTVINKWPGTSPDPVARKKIVNQIVSDVTNALYDR